MPACRQMSLTGTPASACLRIETIWVSVKRDFFMEPPGWGKHARKFYLWGVCGSGKLTLIDRWDRDRQAAPDSSRIILTHTNAEVRELNEAARDRMREAGDLGEDMRVTVERGERSFAAGDRVMFLPDGTSSINDHRARLTSEVTKPISISPSTRR